MEVQTDLKAGFYIGLTIDGGTGTRLPSSTENASANASAADSSSASPPPASPSA